MSWLDRGTRRYWRFRGRPVDLDGSEQWLDAPMHDSSQVGAGWLPTGSDSADGAGLLADMAQLDGPTFRAADLRPEIRDFYERTSRWRMEVWTQWNAVFQPGGELVSRLFGRRVRQLALPTRPLDVARGMDSRVVPILGSDGDQQAAAWIRTLRSTGEYVYSGCYSTKLLPGARNPSVHVAFPLESGNIQVLLEPVALPDGALELRSPPGRFGQNGAYAVVEDDGRTYAARIPIHETFHVYVDDEGTLRTDHALHLWSARVVRLHYKLAPA
ncbi:hypothetical protein SAMN02982929_04760 [Saccharopolyspora kobensis]|uniref:DUF4166 domain-containing protein n=2 Tax=Saccharopolyspora kobensis TaxID=146035 RepID=A0A1H6DRG8_9PSEU|nr:hypothetical protein SAMN02982929_04760 [Saccharopolyspora kobensis]SFE07438.1 hypothetical protein SAMN05216506_108268 [Saccharopolyspora kobensis]